MNATLERLQPGYVLSLCAGCANRLADLSHPSPCRRVRWAGHHRVGPTITSDAPAVACDDQGVRCRAFRACEE